ncbi:MAG TPA: glycosyltransferase family 39 protein [Lacipirellulaceae bacterium]|nr:glycosyltransferase family 39 protein [Lacipirellulaceae bacterium]
MKKWLSISLVIVAGLLVGQAAYVVWRGSDDVSAVAWRPGVRWIGPTEPGYQAYFRHSFYIDSLPTSAWLRLSADSSFDLYVNGRLVSREDTPTNNAKGLGAGLKSQISQPLSDTRVYRAPIESTIAVTSVPDWKLCVYEDIGKYLVAGRNVIAVAVGSSVTKPRLAIEGTIRITPEREVNLATGEGKWIVSSRPDSNDGHIWYEPEYADQYWSMAERLGSVSEDVFSRLRVPVLDVPPHGCWITGQATMLGDILLRGKWNLSNNYGRAYIRVSSNVSAGIMINGQLIDEPDQTKQNVGRLLIYEVSRLLHEGANTIAVRLTRPIANERPTIGGESPKVFLDGWANGRGMDLNYQFATDQTWTALAQPAAGWYTGAGNGVPALALGTNGLNNLSREVRGDATAYDYLAAGSYFGLAMLIGIGVVAALVVALGHWWLPSEPAQKTSNWCSAAALILPGTVAMALIAVLQHRYAEDEIALYVTEYRTALISLIAFCLALYFSLLAVWMSGVRRNETWANGWRFLPIGALACIVAAAALPQPAALYVALALLVIGSILVVVPFFGVAGRVYQRIRVVSSRDFVVATLLAILVVGGFALRTRGLPVSDLSPDENTSFDVIHGILRTGGAPESTSGIWYTRSPAYHYAAAIWLDVFGDSISAAQLFSVLFGTAMLPLGFVLSKQLTKRDDVSLLIVALMACDQWLIVLSHAIRFYIVVQFLTLLCFYLFYKGFVEKSRASYRYGFLLAATAAMLNQEMMVTLIPIFGIGFLIFYRPFTLRKDWPLLLGTAVMLSVFFFDVFVFYVKCLTPFIALGTTTDSIAKPHLRYVTGFLGGFFVGSARVHFVYTFFFFAGFIYSWIRRDWWRIFLFISVLMYLVELTVLIRQISVRYTSPMYPLLLILAVTSAFEIARGMASAFGNRLAQPAVLRVALCLMVLLTLLTGQQYAQVLWPNDDHLTKGTTQAARFIRDHATSSDVVVSPVAPPAAVELGGLDYYLSSNVIYFDVPYRDGDFIRDRWGGGQLVTNPEAFSRIFETADRVWLYYDEVSESKMSPEMRYYLRTTGRAVMESYAATVRVWDRDRDPFPFVPREGRDIGTY